MRAVLLAVLVAASVATGATAPLRAQTDTPSPSDGADASLLVVLDASGSMAADAGDGASRMEAAREAVRDLVAELPDDARVGLRVYGHRVGNDEELQQEGCRDTELVVPVQPLDRAAITQAVDGFEPTGWTPIGRSLRAAHGDLPETGSRTVVLVSDGIDTCAPPDACEVAKDLVEGGVDLTVHTVGFQVDPAARRQLQCIADATDGQYRDAPDAAALSSALREQSLRALREYAAVGVPVRGADRPEDAPVLGAGLYADELVGDVERWYATEVAAGQRVTFSFTFIGRRDTSDLVSRLLIESWIPGGESRCARDSVSRAGHETEVVTIETTAEADADDPCRAPGQRRYWVKLSSDNLAGLTYRSEILVDVAGEDAEGDQPTATATAAPPGGSASASPAADAVAADRADGAAGHRGLFAVVGAVAGLLVGFGGVRLAVRR